MKSLLSRIRAVISLGLFSTLILSSCVSSKKLETTWTTTGKRKVTFEYTDFSGATPATKKETHKFNSWKRIYLTEKNDELTILYANTKNSIEKPSQKGQPNQKINSFKFPTHDAKTSIKKDGRDLSNRFTYLTGKPIFQAISVPFKFRKEKGDLPSSVSTSFNAGFGLGYSLTFNRYSILYTNGTKTGSDKSSFSITPGVFWGLTPVSYSTENNSMITTSQTVPGNTIGGFLTFGINKFNFGFAIGKDNSWSEFDGGWAYENELWWGLILSIGFIK